MSWEQVLTNEVLDIRDGTHDSPKYKETGFPLITSKNLKNGVIDFSDVSLISEEDYVSINKRSKVNKGDILYSMIGSIGNYAFVDNEPDYAIKNVALFKFSDERLYNRYFLHLLNSFIINRQIDRAMKGGTQKFVSLKILRNLEIPLPPLPQQKKIVAILDAADGYRQKTKALIEKYDELTHSLFLDLFGDPVTNPKGWEIKQLKEFGRIVTGNTPSRKNENNYSSDHIEWIKTDNISSELLYVTKAKEYLSEDGLRNGRSVKAGSLLVACIAGSIKSIGRAALTNRKVAFNQQINAIEPSSKTNSQFLYHMFKSCPEYIQDHASHGMKRMLSKGDFQQIKMVLPPLDLQNQFAEKVEAIEVQKAQAQESLAKAEDLFNSLLQKAFKGELV